MAASFAWFEKWGWKKLWDWGTRPTFGAVGSGKGACIFLCQGAQGGRGRGANTTTFQQQGDEEGDKGVWMSVWVDDVDQFHKHCVAAGLEVTFPHRYAVERPRNAPETSGWPRVPRRAGIRAQKVEPADPPGVNRCEGHLHEVDRFLSAIPSILDLPSSPREAIFINMVLIIIDIMSAMRYIT